MYSYGGGSAASFFSVKIRGEVAGVQCQGVKKNFPEGFGGSCLLYRSGLDAISIAGSIIVI